MVDISIAIKGLSNKSIKVSGEFEASGWFKIRKAPRTINLQGVDPAPSLKTAFVRLEEQTSGEYQLTQGTVDDLRVKNGKGTSIPVRLTPLGLLFEGNLTGQREDCLVLKENSDRYEFQYYWSLPNAQYPDQEWPVNDKFWWVLFKKQLEQQQIRIEHFVFHDVSMSGVPWGVLENCVSDLTDWVKVKDVFIIISIEARIAIQDGGFFCPNVLVWDESGITLERVNGGSTLQRGATEEAAWRFDFKEASIHAVEAGKPLPVVPRDLAHAQTAWLRLRGGWVRPFDFEDKASLNAKIMALTSGLSLPWPGLEASLIINADDEGVLGPVVLDEKTQNVQFALRQPRLNLKMPGVIRWHDSTMAQLAPSAHPVPEPLSDLNAQTIPGQVHSTLRLSEADGAFLFELSAVDAWMRLPDIFLDSPKQWVGEQHTRVSDRVGLLPVRLAPLEDVIKIDHKRLGDDQLELDAKQWKLDKTGHVSGLRQAPGRSLYGLMAPPMQSGADDAMDYRGLELDIQHNKWRLHHAVAWLELAYLFEAHQTSPHPVGMNLIKVKDAYSAEGHLKDDIITFFENKSYKSNSNSNSNVVDTPSSVDQDVSVDGSWHAYTGELSWVDGVQLDGEITSALIGPAVARRLVEVNASFKDGDFDFKAPPNNNRLAVLYSDGSDYFIDYSLLECSTFRIVLQMKRSKDTSWSYNVRLFKGEQRSKKLDAQVIFIANRVLIVWAGHHDFDEEMQLDDDVGVKALTRVFLEARLQDNEFKIHSGIIGWEAGKLGKAVAEEEAQVTIQFGQGKRQIVLNGVWTLETEDNFNAKLNATVTFERFILGESQAQRAWMTFDVTIRNEHRFALPVDAMCRGKSIALSAHFALVEVEAQGQYIRRGRTFKRTHRVFKSKKNDKLLGYGHFSFTLGDSVELRPDNEDDLPTLNVITFDEPLSSQRLSRVMKFAHLTFRYNSSYHHKEALQAVVLDEKGEVYFNDGLSAVESVEHHFTSPHRVLLLQEDFGLTGFDLKVTASKGDDAEHVKRQAMRALARLSWRREAILETMSKGKIQWTLLDSPLQHDDLPMGWLNPTPEGAPLPQPTPHEPAVGLPRLHVEAGPVASSGEVASIHGVLMLKDIPTHLIWWSQVPFVNAPGPWRSSNVVHPPQEFVRRSVHALAFDQAVVRPGEKLQTRFEVFYEDKTWATQLQSTRAPRASDDVRQMPATISRVDGGFSVRATESRRARRPLEEKVNIIVSDPNFESSNQLGARRRVQLHVIAKSLEPDTKLEISFTNTNESDTPIDPGEISLQIDGEEVSFDDKHYVTVLLDQSETSVDDYHVYTFTLAFSGQSPEVNFVRFKVDEFTKSYQFDETLSRWPDHVGLLCYREHHSYLVGFGPVDQQWGGQLSEESNQVFFVHERAMEVTLYGPVDEKAEYRLFRLRADGSVRTSSMVTLS